MQEVALKSAVENRKTKNAASFETGVVVPGAGDYGPLVPMK